MPARTAITSTSGKRELRDELDLELRKSVWLDWGDRTRHPLVAIDLMCARAASTTTLDARSCVPVGGVCSAGAIRRRRAAGE